MNKELAEDEVEDGDEYEEGEDPVRSYEWKYKQACGPEELEGNKPEKKVQYILQLRTHRLQGSCKIDA
jgi:hypothetical protein